MVYIDQKNIRVSISQDVIGGPRCTFNSININGPYNVNNYFGLSETQYFTISKFLLFLFSGLNCEIDVSICNATTLFGNRLKPHCSNGGQCIDGLGAEFFCECPTGKKHYFYPEI